MTKRISSTARTATPINFRRPYRSRTTAPIKYTVS